MANIVEALDLQDLTKNSKYLSPFIPSKPNNVSSSYKYIGTMSDMIHVVSTILTEQKVLAVDIESSPASYEGFICLV